MADAKIVDIKGVQWELKDEVARNKIAEFENLYKDYGNIGVDNASVFCTRNKNMLLFQGQTSLQMSLGVVYKIANIPTDLVKKNTKASGPIFDYSKGNVVGMVYRPEDGDGIYLYFTNGITTEERIYTFQLISYQQTM